MSARTARLLRNMIEGWGNLFVVDDAKYRRPESSGFARDRANLRGDMARVTADFERALRRAEEEAKGIEIA
jgi:hypothetical protein